MSDDQKTDTNMAPPPAVMPIWTKIKGELAQGSASKFTADAYTSAPAMVSLAQLELIEQLCREVSSLKQTLALCLSTNGKLMGEALGALEGIAGAAEKMAPQAISGCACDNPTPADERAAEFDREDP